MDFATRFGTLRVCRSAPYFSGASELPFSIDAQLSAAARKAIDEDVVRVKSAWRERRIARESVPMVTPRAAVATASIHAPTTAAPGEVPIRPLALQRGRLLDTLEATQ